MKKTTFLKGFALSVAVSSISFSSHSQGTFIYDQQSSVEGNDGLMGLDIQLNQPIGQSFTPTNLSVGFIRLRLGDYAPDGLSSTVLVYLRSDSITGPVLATSDPVTIPNGAFTYTDFFFAAPAPVIPGLTYFFQPGVQSGGACYAALHNAFFYAGGNLYSSGQPATGWDLWFREGVVVPEPASGLLLIFGVVAATCLRRFRAKPN